MAPSLTSTNDDLIIRLCSEPYVTGGQPEDPRLVVLDSEVPAPDYTEGKDEDMENFTFAGATFKGSGLVGNEKRGGSGSKLLLEYSFGPWRLISV